MHHLKTVTDTHYLASLVALKLKAEDVVLFEGDLGAGKTEFVRGMIQTLFGKQEVVASPTFTLVQPYDTELFTIWHYDLYRLDEPEEVYQLGIEDHMFQDVCLIEWPERLPNILPESYLKIKLSYGKDSSRLVEFEAHGSWQERIKEIEDE